MIVGSLLRAPEYFVAANGSDSNPGTRSQPWLTLTKVNATTFSPGTRIFFRGGDAFYGTLTNPSSGHPSAPVIYASYGTGRADLSGGLVVSTWTQVDVPKNIWRATFSAASGRPRAVWVNNRRCTRSRTSSVGTMTPTSTGWTSPLLASATAVTDVELHMKLAFWSVKFVQVSAATGTTISVSTSVKAIMNTAQSIWGGAGGSNVPYEAENIYEVFTADAVAGTFYQDRTNNFLYLIPPTGISDPNAATVVAGVRENVISFNGVSDVVVGNLGIRHTTALRPYHTDAYIDTQSGACAGTDIAVNASTWVGTLTTMEAAITLDTCARVKLVRTLVCGVAGVGVKIKGASILCEVDGNIVRDTGGHGIQLGEPGYEYNESQLSQPTAVPQPTLTSIHDSIVRGSGVDFISHSNLAGFYFDNATISYNIFRDTPYSNVAIGWGFGYYQAGFMSANLVERNNIYGGMTRLDDGGGIYSNGIQETTTTIRNNWVHDIAVGNGSALYTCGIYLDGGSYQNSVTGNVINTSGAYNYQINSGENFRPRLNPAPEPNNAITGNTDDANAYRNDSGVNSISNTTVSTATAQIAGAALSTGPRAAYASVIAEDAALTV